MMAAWRNREGLGTHPDKQGKSRKRLQKEPRKRGDRDYIVRPA